MKFTSEDLMKAKKALGEIIRYNLEETYDNGVEIGYENPLQDECYLISKALEELERLLPRPKRVGDLKCGEYGEHNCNSCPIRAICVSDEYNDETLYSKLELSHKFAQDQEIYDLLKARLDKEVA